MSKPSEKAAPPAPPSPASTPSRTSESKTAARSSSTEASTPPLPQPVPPKDVDAPPVEGEFFNREKSWLEFNRRVLHEALDERTPLLERVGFLAIFSSNLDEYYQKRVGGFKRQIEVGILTRSPDGNTPEQQLDLIRRTVIPMLEEQADCFLETVRPALAQKNIHLLTWDQLNEAEQDAANDYFVKNLFPVVTPLSVDPGHPFPFISNLSTSLGVMLQHPGEHPQAHAGSKRGNAASAPIHDPSVPDEAGDGIAGRLQFARVKIPQVLPAWLRLPDEATGDPAAFRFVSTEQIIRQNLQRLFEGMIIKHIEPFRITRNADIERDEDDTEDLLELIEQELQDRRFAKVIRLETDDIPFHPLNHFLMQELGLRDQDVYHMPAELDYTNLWTIHGGVNRPDLKYEPWTPIIPARLREPDGNIFNIIRNGDILVHHPYESFSASVERFIRRAATDPE